MRLADWTGLPPEDLDRLDVGGLPGRVPVGRSDVDADGDGAPDTVVVAGDDGFSLFTDLDGDMLADQELRLGAELRYPRPDDPGPVGRGPDEEPWWAALGDLLGAALGR